MWGGKKVVVDAEGNSPVFPKQAKTEFTFEKPGCSKLPQFVLASVTTSSF